MAEAPNDEDRVVLAFRRALRHQPRGAEGPGGDGWADVWKRHHFAWEYKGQRADLDAAFNQLRQYSLALENPAAAARVRHGAVPDPHELDEQRQPDARVRAG